MLCFMGGSGLTSISNLQIFLSFSAHLGGNLWVTGVPWGIGY